MSDTRYARRRRDRPWDERDVKDKVRDRRRDKTMLNPLFLKELCKLLQKVDQTNCELAKKKKS